MSEIETQRIAIMAKRFAPAQALYTSDDQLWHSGLSPHRYTVIDRNSSQCRQCYGCGMPFLQGHRIPPHNLIVMHFDRRIIGAERGRVRVNKFYQRVYYHGLKVCVQLRNPIFSKIVHGETDVLSNNAQSVGQLLNEGFDVRQNLEANQLGH